MKNDFGVPPPSGWAGDAPPPWNVSTHPLRELERFRELKPYQVSLKCPVCKDGELELYKTNIGPMKLNGHSCTKCNQHFGLPHGATYPTRRYEFVDYDNVMSWEAKKAE